MHNSNTDIWIAGAVAAVSVDFMVYPFDTLKTRMQSADYDTRYKNPQTGAIRRSVLFRGLYQGVWSVVFATIPASGAFFTTYEGVKHILGNLTWPTGAQRSPQSQNVTYSLLPTPVVHAIASSCGEMVSCLMITPAEVLKQNAQVVHNQGNGQGGGGVGGGRGRAGRNASLEVISRFRHKPWKLWSGYTALVGRNLPFTGLHFPLFEYVRSHLVDWREARNKSSPEGPGSRWNPIIERATLTGLAAGFAGTVASVITTPIDVIKTRVMLAATDSPASADSSGSGGGDNVIKDEKVKRKFATLDVGREIYRKEGIRGLFRGGLLKAGWTALGLGLYLAFYEGGRLYLENRRKDKENGGRKEGDSIV